MNPRYLSFLHNIEEFVQHVGCAAKVVPDGVKETPFPSASEVLRMFGLCCKQKIFGRKVKDKLRFPWTLLKHMEQVEFILT